jgi:hypothetical protein
VQPGRGPGIGAVVLVGQKLQRAGRLGEDGCNVFAARAQDLADEQPEGAANALARYRAVVGVRSAVHRLRAMHDAEHLVRDGLPSLPGQGVAGDQPAHGVGDQDDLVRLSIRNELLEPLSGIAVGIEPVVAEGVDRQIQKDLELGIPIVQAAQELSVIAPRDAGPAPLLGQVVLLVGFGVAAGHDLAALAEENAHSGFGLC